MSGVCMQRRSFSNSGNPFAAVADSAQQEVSGEDEAEEVAEKEEEDDKGEEAGAGGMEEEAEGEAEAHMRARF